MARRLPSTDLAIGTDLTGARPTYLLQLPPHASETGIHVKQHRILFLAFIPSGGGSPIFARAGLVNTRERRGKRDDCSCAPSRRTKLTLPCTDAVRLGRPYGQTELGD